MGRALRLSGAGATHTNTALRLNADGVESIQERETSFLAFTGRSNKVVKWCGQLLAQVC